MSEWISVKERMPELPQPQYGYQFSSQCAVIAANEHGEVMELNYERAIARHKEVYRWARSYCRLYDGPPITHWMPLPEPPKGDTE